ncbi:hypothetical protein DENSPDRAFT_589017 [Dentipellis sp. KUC8613]|nr:hypothetical protein DENSPDRAFT_589017 [Dentipellis sp. KUC8613]
MSRYKLVFFVPVAATQSVLSHLFSRYPTVLGKIGNYQHCAFVTRGTGQFRPCDGANPTIGAVGTLEHVEEDRVEIVVNDGGDQADLKGAIQELKQVHPYEEVAYDVYKLEDF